MTLENVQHLLPDSIREMAEVIGLPATMRVVDALGGLSVDFPSDPQAMLPLTVEQQRQVLGDKVLCQLSTYFAGEKLYIPRCETALRAVRNQQFIDNVAEIIEDGYSMTSAIMQLCPKYKISDRTAWKILSKKNTQSVQKPLF